MNTDNKTSTLDCRIEALESVVKDLCFATGDNGLLEQRLREIVKRKSQAIVERDEAKEGE